jgi:hypothetical protein
VHELPACRSNRAGRVAGYLDGFSEGYSEGYAAGAAGWPALLHAVTGAEGANDSALSAAEDLKADSDAPVPADVADLCRQVAAVPGVDLSRLIAGLAPERQAMERTLENLIRRARSAAQPKV